MVAGFRLLGLDLKATADEISEFIRTNISEANAKGVVIGLSGGVDSSLVAALCVQALGKVRVFGVLMPTNFTPKDDIEDAEKLAKQLDIKTAHINIQEIGDTFTRILNIENTSQSRLFLGNIWARIRMVILYHYANINNYLVVGTGCRSEALIGFFTKYGDGGIDLSPIGDLYKTQVRALAEYLGVPKKVAYKPSSPQLYPGHKATDEIPLPYEALDPVLVELFENAVKFIKNS